MSNMMQLINCLDDLEGTYNRILKSTIADIEKSKLLKNRAEMLGYQIIAAARDPLILM